jgi:ankyrin repeat protein
MIAEEVGILRELLDGRADCEIRNADDKIPLHRALLRSKPQLVGSFIGGLLKSVTDANGQSLEGVLSANYATQIEETNILRLLLSHEAQVDSSLHDSGFTPLHVAVTTGHLSAVKLLLQKNADIEAKDNVGNTSLHRAAYD